MDLREIPQALYGYPAPFLTEDGSDQFVVKSLDDQFVYRQTATLCHHQLGPGSLEVELLCERISLTTRSGVEISGLQTAGLDPVLRYSNGTQTIQFDDFDHAQRAFRIQHGDIDAESNCHGLTFAYSRYVIDNRLIRNIINAEYESCPAEVSEMVIYFQNGEIIHSARRTILEGKETYLAKGGIRGISLCRSVQEASCGLGFNSVEYYRLK